MDIPHLVAQALVADGWYLRIDMPWVKRSAMPSSVTDRPSSALEYVFLLTKSATYYFDQEAVRKEMAPASVGRYAYSFGGPRNEKLAEMDKEGMGNRIRPIGDREPTNGRNFRNTDLWFESIREPFGVAGLGDEWLGIDATSEPTSEAHFAAFPQKLVKPLVLAGSSAKGKCPQCGAAWVRVVEKEQYHPEIVPVGVRNVDASRGDKVRKLDGKSEAWKQASASRATTGWSPLCSCPPADPIPDVILDPFMGTATVAIVALKNGRGFTGVELNQEYMAIALRRVEECLGKGSLFQDIESKE